MDIFKSSVKVRRILAITFCGISAIIVSSTILSQIFWLSLLGWFLVFFYLWSTRMPGYSVLLALTLISISLLTISSPFFQNPNYLMDLYYKDECAVPISEYPPINIERRPPSINIEPTKQPLGYHQDIFLHFSSSIDYFNSANFASELAHLLKISPRQVRVRIRDVKPSGEFNCMLQIYEDRSSPQYRTSSDLAKEIRNYIKNRSHYISKYNIQLIDRPDEDEEFLGGEANIDLHSRSFMRISGGNPPDICQGQYSNLTFTMKGDSSYWFIVFNDGKDTYQFNVTENPYILPWEKAGIFKLGEASEHIFTTFAREAAKPRDSFCDVEFSGEAVIRVHSPPTVEIIETGPVCESDPSNSIAMRLHLTGTPPWKITYLVQTLSGDLHVRTEETFSEYYDIKSQKPGTYKLLNVTDKFCVSNLAGRELTIKTKPCCGPKILRNSGPFHFDSTYGCNLFCGWLIQPDQTVLDSLVLRFSTIKLNRPEDKLCIYDGPTSESKEIHCFVGPIFSNKMKEYYSTGSSLYVLFKTGDRECENFDGGFSAYYDSVIEEKSCDPKLLPTFSIRGGQCVGSDITISFTGHPPFTLHYYENGFLISERYEMTSIHKILEDKEYIFDKVTDLNCIKKVKSTPISIKPKSAPTARLSVSGEPHILKGKEGNLRVELTGVPPWEFVITDGFTERFFRDVREPTFLVSITKPGEYKIKENSLRDNSGCIGKVVGSEFISFDFYDLPQASFEKTPYLCVGQLSERDTGTDLSIQFSGISPWSITYSDGRKDFISKGIVESPFTITITKPGRYSLKNVVDSYGNLVEIKNEQVDVIEHPLPSLSLLTKEVSICQGTQSFIKLKLSGTPPFKITYSNGKDFIDEEVEQIPNDGIHSMDIKQSGTYSFVRISDRYCSREYYNDPPKVIVDSSNAPTVRISSGVCLGEKVKIDLTGTGPWTLVYYVDPFQSTTISSNQRLGWEPSPSSKMFTILIYETPFLLQTELSGLYHFTAIHDANKCGGTIYGSPIRIVDKPVAELLPGSGSVCKDSTSEVLVKLTGQPPWTITYTNGQKEFTETSIFSSPHRIQVTEAATWRIISVSDSLCSHGITKGEATITQYPPPTIRIQAGNYICAGKPIVIEKLTGKIPWQVSYTNETNQVYTHPLSHDNTIIIPTKKRGNSPPITYRFFDIRDSNCASSSQHEISVYPLPTAHISGGGSVCASNSHSTTTVPLDITLTGTPPWSITLKNSAQPDMVIPPVTGITTSVYEYQTSVPGHYYLTSVEDFYCRYP